MLTSRSILATIAAFTLSASPAMASSVLRYADADCTITWTKTGTSNGTDVGTCSMSCTGSCSANSYSGTKETKGACGNNASNSLGGSPCSTTGP
jgi:hypothetical protein